MKTFDEWWDESKSKFTPGTYKGWEDSCREAFNANKNNVAELQILCADLLGELSTVEYENDPPKRVIDMMTKTRVLMPNVKLRGSAL